MDRTLDHPSGDRVEPAPQFSKGTTVGHFSIIGELGAGGMGIVYEAHDPDLDRRVAIKVVRDRDAGSAAGARLILEAQAMARLGHPNVVAVHEVGTIDGQVFLVMELVRGQTLATWLETPRSWREIVGTFVQAGEGLAAAHHANLIHRDFKPSNVLVDERGRARVGDFGLAREDGGDQSRLAVGSDPVRVAGTPAYMAPEQRAGGPVDARADQYAFAISLQQALSPGHVVDTPPPRIRKAIMRALAIEPDARFATIDDLLVELRRAFRSRRRLVLALTATVAISAAAALGVASLLQRAPDDCDNGANLIDSVWGSVARDAQAARFVAARPTATVAITTTAHALDEWAASWRLGWHAACRAEPAPRMARLACLDAALDELRAQLAAWSHPGPEVVDRAVTAALALPEPKACAQRTTGANVSWIARPILDRAAALRAADRVGHAASMKPQLAALLADANATNDPEARASALLAVAMIKYSTGDVAGARSDLAEAAVAAGHAGDDPMLFDALRDEAITVTDLGRPLDSLGMLDAAEAVSARAGLDREWQIATVRGNALIESGRYVDAIKVIDGAIAILETRAQRDSKSEVELATALSLLATAHTQAFEFDQSIPFLKRAIAIQERLLGPLHPNLGKTLGDLAEAELNLNRFDDAVAHIERAHDIFVAAYGPDNTLVAQVDVSRANIAGKRGKSDEAIALYEKATKALAKTLPPDSDNFVTIETGMAAVERDRNRCDAAIPHYQRGLAILEHRSPGGAAHGGQLVLFAECLAMVGRSDEAYAAATRSLAELEEAHVPPMELAETWVTLADLEAKRGHRARALELAHKLLASTKDADDPEIAKMRHYEQGQVAAWSK